MVSLSAHRDGDPSVMIDSARAHKDIPNLSTLGSETTSCPNTDDEVRLMSLAG